MNLPLPSIKLMSFSYTRPKPTDTSLLASSVSLSPSSVTGHPGKLSFTHFQPTDSPRPPTTHSCSIMESPVPSWPKEASIFTLQEIAGVNSLVRVNVPFSLSELSQVEKKIRAYIANFFTFIKDFQYITQSYDLTFYRVLYDSWQ